METEAEKLKEGSIHLRTLRTYTLLHWYLSKQFY